MKYLSSKTVTQILGVTAQTLRNWDKEGKLNPGLKYEIDSKNVTLKLKETGTNK